MAALNRSRSFFGICSVYDFHSPTTKASLHDVCSSSWWWIPDRLRRPKTLNSPRVWHPYRVEMRPDSTFEPEAVSRLACRQVGMSEQKQIEAERGRAAHPALQSGPEVPGPATTGPRSSSVSGPSASR